MSTPDGPEAPRPETERRLRGPDGCLEWAVVVMGVVYVALLVAFVVALAVR